MPAVVMFDGTCNLCSGVVQFIIARDPDARFRFAPLAAIEAETIVLVDRGSTFTRSTAVLRIARRLCFPWPVMYLLILVPRPIRDAVYDFVARRRYRWFGRREACLVPTADLKARFLIDTQTTTQLR
jgi:predicted DCC family thiol-disulfide oxidoreductase YuxK